MVSAAPVTQHHPALQRAPVLLFFLGITLNQTSVLFNINLSIADFFALLLLVLTLLTARLLVPLGPTIYFLALSILVLIMGGFVVPNFISLDQSYLDVLTDYIKLATSFAYFLLGFNIVRAGQARIVLRAFAFMAVVVGGIGALQTAIPVLPRFDFMFYYEIRFTGLMSDPNYFAVIQLVAMAVLWHDQDISRRIRYPALIALASSVLASGSKTGMLALLIFLVWRGLPTVFSFSNRSRYISPYRAVLIGLVVCAPVLLLIVLLDYSMRMSLATGLDQVPALSRLTPLLLDFEAGVEGDGSGRDSAWFNAIQIIGLFPLFGVGMGTYLEVATEFTDVPVLAHNTFLQIAAEWGLIFTAIFLVWVIVLFLRRPPVGASLALWHSTRDALLVLMIGSGGISLQNSRLLWFIIGMLLAVHVVSKTQESLQQRSFQQEVQQ